MTDRRKFLGASAGAAALTSLAPLGSMVPTGAFAQASPGNVVRICNGFPPGSSADALSRVVANKLTTAGAPCIVENRAGAGGRLAVDNVKNSPADGQSILITPDAIMVLYPHVYRSLPYDALKDFRAVTTLATVPLAFAVGPLVPAEVKTMGDFARWAKANPAAASFGTSGAGSTLHFTGVMFARSAGIELTHVPYRGANLAAQDVAAGQLAACVAVLSDVLALAQGEKLRLLGVSSEKRSRFMPAVATFREQGLKDIEWLTWYGMFLPARTPDAKAAALQAQVVEVMKQPDVAESLAKFGMEPMTMASAPFASLMRTDTDRWAAVVKQVGYTAIE